MVGWSKVFDDQSRCRYFTCLNDWGRAGYYFEFPHFFYPLQLYAEKVWYPRILQDSPGVVFNKVPQSDKVISSRLTFLCITATSIVENICLPLLRRLSVEFYRTSDDTLPQIRNIHAPYLLVFRVHFSGRMPILSQIDVCSFQNSCKRTFELVDTNATSPIAFTRNSTTEYTEYQDMNFDFLSHLDIVSLTGVPDFVFNAADQKKQLRELHWHHSVAYTHPTMPVRADIIELENLRSLTIVSAAPNFTPPEFVTPKLQYLIVSLTGFNPSLGELIPNAAKGCDLCFLHVVSIPSDKRLIGHPHAHITLSLEDLASIQVTVDDCGREPKVTFQGCFIGEENSLLDMGPHRLFTRIAKPPNLKKHRMAIRRNVNLICVRPLGDTSETLRIQFLKHTNLPLDSFVVGQLFNERDKPWRKLTYAIPVGRLHLGIKHHGFEEVIPTGFILHVPGAPR